MAKSIRATRGAVIRIRAVGLRGTQGEVGPSGDSGLETWLANDAGAFVDGRVNGEDYAPAGAWDFQTAPTVNGSPIGTGGGSVVDASTTVKGIVELATTTETTTGTDTARATTPAGVAAKVAAALAAYSPTSHTHATTDLTGNLPLANVAKGSSIFVQWDGTDWLLGGVAYNGTTRPIASLDVRFILLDITGTAVEPEWAVSGHDLKLKAAL